MIDTSTAVVGAIAKISCVAEANIRPDSNLAKDLGIDSIDKVEVAIEIEERLGSGIYIDDGDIADALTVAELIKAVDVVRAR